MIGQGLFGGLAGDDRVKVYEGIMVVFFVYRVPHNVTSKDIAQI